MVTCQQQDHSFSHSSPPLSHQDVPFSLTASTQGEGDLGLVRAVLPGVQVDVLAGVEATDRRSAVSGGGSGALGPNTNLGQSGGHFPDLSLEV